MSEIEQQEALKLLKEIHQQQQELKTHIEAMEKKAARSGAMAGAGAGAFTAGLIAVGVEFIKATVK